MVAKAFANARGFSEKFRQGHRNGRLRPEPRKRDGCASPPTALSPLHRFRLQFTMHTHRNKPNNVNVLINELLCEHRDVYITFWLYHLTGKWVMIDTFLCQNGNEF